MIKDMRLYKKVMQDITKEMHKQIDIFYAAAAVIWWKEYGWRETRIMRRFDTTTKLWDECNEWGVKKSMLQMPDMTVLIMSSAILTEMPGTERC